MLVTIGAAGAKASVGATGGDEGVASGAEGLGRFSTGKPMLPEIAAVGFGAWSAGLVAFEAGALPGRGHWKPGIPSSPTGSAGLVGVAGLDVVAAADVGATGYPVLSCVLEGWRDSEVGTMTDAVGSVTGALVSPGCFSEVERVGMTYEPDKNERIGTLVGISVGMVA